MIFSIYNYAYNFVRRYENSNQLCIKPDKTKLIITDGIKHSMNPFYAVVIEKPVRMKGKKIAQGLMAVNCGPIQPQDTIKTALAMADRGVHIEISDIASHSI